MTYKGEYAIENPIFPSYLLMILSAIYITFVYCIWRNRTIYSIVVMFQNRNRSRNPNPRMSDIMFKEIGSEQFFVFCHSNRNNLVDNLEYERIMVYLEFREVSRLPNTVIWKDSTCQLNNFLLSNISFHLTIWERTSCDN